MPALIGTRRVLLGGGFVDPRSIPGLEQWGAARLETAYADTNAVSSASDWSGKARALTQGTGAAQPTYRTNVINGKPVFRFDGGDVLTHATLGSFLTGNFTIIAVVRGTTKTAEMMTVSWGDLTNGEARRLWVANVTGNLGFSGFGAAANFASTTNVKDGNAQLCVITFDGTTARIRSNGVQRTTGTPTLAAYTDNALGIGANSGGTEGYTDDIAEWALYSQVVAGADLANLERYFAAPYGITIP